MMAARFSRRGASTDVVEARRPGVFDRLNKLTNLRSRAERASLAARVELN